MLHESPHKRSNVRPLHDYAAQAVSEKARSRKSFRNQPVAVLLVARHRASRTHLQHLKANQVDHDDDDAPDDEGGDQRVRQAVRRHQLPLGLDAQLGHGLPLAPVQPAAALAAAGRRGLGGRRRDVGREAQAEALDGGRLRLAGDGGAGGGGGGGDPGGGASSRRSPLGPGSAAAAGCWRGDSAAGVGAAASGGGATVASAAAAGGRGSMINERARLSIVGREEFRTERLPDSEARATAAASAAAPAAAGGVAPRAGGGLGVKPAAGGAAAAAAAAGGSNAGVCEGREKTAKGKSSGECGPGEQGAWHGVPSGTGSASSNTSSGVASPSSASATGPGPRSRRGPSVASATAPAPPPAPWKNACPPAALPLPRRTTPLTRSAECSGGPPWPEGVAAPSRGSGESAPV
ncbi:hypothetical protein TSOC_007452 [Tetrabaena socialis]|uniref:Uncharacterized protein n=1 Tax=Tetrabaena socialis TaxID=47790 RepID=A0A2J8A0Z0_9CHLO|nr:hypothetical protein TSOC_007452 [Tetrabaena socialis]|eukprot:PNH06187.1 hypothetical protein TSOC_007452 [Tetrabaena socialis]